MFAGFAPAAFRGQGFRVVPPRAVARPDIRGRRLQFGKGHILRRHIPGRRVILDQLAQGRLGGWRKTAAATGKEVFQQRPGRRGGQRDRFLFAV